MAVIPLGELAEVVSGGTPRRSEPRFFDGHIPWVKIGDMVQGTVTSTEESITEEGLKASTAKVLPAGTLLLSIFATIGRTAVLTIDAATNQAIAGLLVRDPSRVDGRYLRRYLEFASKGLARQGRGVAQANINLSILRAHQIPLPPLGGQQRIAEILDVADTVRVRRREAIDRLDTLTQAIFFDMFDARPHIGAHTPVEALGDAAEVQGGLQVTTKRKDLPLAAPYLRVANVYRGYLNLSVVKEIRLTESELQRTQLEAGDLLVVEGHGNKQEIGRVGLWSGEIDGCVHQNHLIRVRCDRARVLPRFAEAYLNSELGRRSLLRAANTTSGLNTISTSDVRAVPIRIPPLGRQKDFLARAEEVDRNVRLAHQQLKTLESLFASLQQRAFRGEL